jgi:hypothetical protein
MSKINAYCDICGRGYEMCHTCRETKTYKPWRTITDTMEHYKIYSAISDYNNGYNDKNKAKEQLSKLDLSELNDFVPAIKKVIEEIMEEESVIVEEPLEEKPITIKKKNYKETTE